MIDIEQVSAMVEMRARIADLERQLAEAWEVLSRWESYGCPDCGGDCASANPPVSLCIMQETARILSALKGKP